jgi:hypothetical protein
VPPIVENCYVLLLKLMDISLKICQAAAKMSFKLAAVKTGSLEYFFSILK